MDRMEATTTLNLRDSFTPKELEDAYRRQLATYTDQARHSLNHKVRARAMESSKAVQDAYHFLKNSVSPPMPTSTPTSSRRPTPARPSPPPYTPASSMPYTPPSPIPQPAPSPAAGASWAYFASSPPPARTVGTGAWTTFDPATISALVVLIGLVIGFAGSRLGCVERKPTPADFPSSPKVSTPDGNSGSVYNTQPPHPIVQHGELVVETPRPAPLYINNQYRGTTDRRQVFTLAPGRYAINLGGRCTFNAWINANERFRMYCRPSSTIGRYLMENLTNPRDSSGWLPLVGGMDR